MRAFLFSLIAWFTAPMASAQTLDAAVAANLRYAFEAIAAAFERDSGIAVRGAYGSSGKLFAQIQHGAPFHLFLSADEDYPRRLYEEGHALAPPRVYALGTLVVWSGRERDLGDWPALIAGGEVRRIALANPRTAPYGRAAIEALKHYGLHETVADKLVVGESVAQASQFVASGNAEIGFTAKSVVLGARPPVPGQWQEVAPEAHAPIAQAAVLLRHAATDREAAQRLLDFLASPAARSILQAQGYRLP